MKSNEYLQKKVSIHCKSKLIFKLALLYLNVRLNMYLRQSFSIQKNFDSKSIKSKSLPISEKIIFVNKELYFEILYFIIE